MTRNHLHGNGTTVDNGRGTVRGHCRPLVHLADHEKSWLPTRRQRIIQALSATAAFVDLLLASHSALVPRMPAQTPNRQVRKGCVFVVSAMDRSTAESMVVIAGNASAVLLVTFISLQIR
jgi:hypothetical protein